MKKLLNTLYISKENVYLSKEGENVVILEEGKTIGRFPIHILDGIVSFSYVGVSPSLMKFCNEKNLLLSFFTPYGRFCGRVIGETNGNVLLRRKQYQMADGVESVEFTSNLIYSKAYNSKKILQRALRDHKDKIDTQRILFAIDSITNLMDEIRISEDKDQIRGIEGTIARVYFSVFDELIINQRKDFYFIERSKRPPLDRLNALLSFLYSMLTYDIQSALEGVGIDSYVGFFHVDRPGRCSMALDLLEEFRGFLCDRSALSMINLSIINKNHFIEKENGAILLNEKGRDKVLEYWQKRKHDIIEHPFLKEKIKIGLLPHVQSMLLNRYIRGDLESYPPFLMKG